MKRVRTVAQVAFVVATAVAGARLAIWNEGGGVERYCPFGGLEAAWALVTGGTFMCSTGALNATLFAALVLSVLVARKAFCGWVCPLGAVSEWMRALGARLRGRRGGAVPRALLADPPPPVDRVLRWLRLPVMAAILALTWKAGELVFRGFDPYYVLFSAGGHDVSWWSWWVLAAVLGLVVAVPMAWCRWLCPLGAALWPFARVGRLRVARDEVACTSCGACDRACGPGLAVSTAPQVASGDCTMCLDCTAACPAGALTLRIRGAAGGSGTSRSRPVPAWVAPVVVAVAAVAGVASADLLTLPTLARDFEAADATGATGAARATRTVTLTVRGVRCARTAADAIAQLDGEAGVIRAEAFGADRRVDVTFDPATTGVDAIRDAIEGPFLDPATGVFVYDRFEVIEVDGGRP
jgi:ferredoxin/copper chaperone CopZ